MHGLGHGSAAAADFRTQPDDAKLWRWWSGKSPEEAVPFMQRFEAHSTTYGHGLPSHPPIPFGVVRPNAHLTSPRYSTAEATTRMFEEEPAASPRALGYPKLWDRLQQVGEVEKRRLTAPIRVAVVPVPEPPPTGKKLTDIHHPMHLARKSDHKGQSLHPPPELPDMWKANSEHFESWMEVQRDPRATYWTGNGRLSIDERLLDEDEMAGSKLPGLFEVPTPRGAPPSPRYHGIRQTDLTGGESSPRDTDGRNTFRHKQTDVVGQHEGIQLERTVVLLGKQYQPNLPLGEHGFGRSDLFPARKSPRNPEEQQKQDSGAYRLVESDVQFFRDPSATTTLRQCARRPCPPQKARAPSYSVGLVDCSRPLTLPLRRAQANLGRHQAAGPAPGDVGAPHVGLAQRGVGQAVGGDSAHAPEPPAGGGSGEPDGEEDDRHPAPVGPTSESARQLCVGLARRLPGQHRALEHVRPSVLEIELLVVASYIYAL